MHHPTQQRRGTTAVSALSRLPLTDTATPTLSATATLPPTGALHHHLGPSRRSDNASRIAVLAVAMVAIQSPPATPHSTDAATIASSTAEQPVLLALEYVECSGAGERRARRYGAIAPSAARRRYSSQPRPGLPVHGNRRCVGPERVTRLAAGYEEHLAAGEGQRYDPCSPARHARRLPRV